MPPFSPSDERPALSRRRLLQLGSSAALATLAGCATAPDEGSTETPTDTPNTSSPVPTTATETPAHPSLRWQTSVAGRIPNQPLFHDGLLYVGSRDGVLVALDAADGTEQWRFDAPNGVFTHAMAGEAMTVANGSLYALSGKFDGLHGQNVRLHALDPATGDEQWSFETNADYESFGILGIADGAVLLGASNDNISNQNDPTIAVETADGSERWRVETGDVSNAALDADTLYVGAATRVYALALADGTERWRYDVGSHDYLGPVVDDRHVYIGTDDDGGWIRAFAPDTGDEQWSFEQWTPTSLTYEGELYLGGPHVGSLTSDGSVRWQSKVAGLLSDVVSTDSVYAFGEDAVTAVARADGSKRWELTTDGKFPHPVALRDGVLVIQERRESVLHAVDAATGDSRWDLELPAKELNPVVTGGNGVFATGEGGTVFARDLRV